MTAPLLLDLTHTSHTRARTGIQRVCRALRRALAAKAASVCFDPFEQAWRPLEAWEEANLAAADPSPARGERWPLSARIRGRARRWGHRAPPLAGMPAAAPGGPSGVIVPEIFSPAVAAALPGLFAASAGPRVALFHDAIALQFPEFTPRSTVARFPSYLRELLAFDGIAANSEASRASLLGFWEWIGAGNVPEVAVIPLGLDPAPTAPAPQATPSLPAVLCVGSIEGRKNHVALLDACQALWDRGLNFRLRMIGLAHAETGGDALARIRFLQAAGRALDYDGPAGEDALEAAYRECTFTVYPSVAEGFGLPVAESLARGKPCICSSRGALGEVARGGGCLALGSVGASDLAEAMGRLIGSPAEVAALSSAARLRRFATWDDYAVRLLAWMSALRRSA